MTAEKSHVIIVANTSAHPAAVTLNYRRIHLPSRKHELVEIVVTVDPGPDIERRAREALAVKLDAWNARDWYTWKFCTEA